jgi:hypothetical protein
VTAPTPAELAGQVRGWAYTARQGELHTVADMYVTVADALDAQAVELAQARHYRSLPDGMVWQDYYSPTEQLALRTELETACAESERALSDARAELGVANATIERVRQLADKALAVKVEGSTEGDAAAAGIAAAILRALAAAPAGPQPTVPHRIDTVAELDALPTDAVIRDANHSVMEKHPHGWLETGYEFEQSVELPVTLLWLPADGGEQQ